MKFQSTLLYTFALFASWTTAFKLIAYDPTGGSNSTEYVMQSDDNYYPLVLEISRDNTDQSTMYIRDFKLDDGKLVLTSGGEANVVTYSYLEGFVNVTNSGMGSTGFDSSEYKLTYNNTDIFYSCPGIAVNKYINFLSVSDCAAGHEVSLIMVD